MFHSLFEGAPVAGVVAALAGYRNADGGFGHGLEPDIRCPASLPVDVEFALQCLVAVGARGDDVSWISEVTTYLADVAATSGAGPAVSAALPVMESFPRADHWMEWAYQPALNPTAGLVGLLYALEISHPWRDAATEWCWDEITRIGVPDDPHTLLEILTFLAHVPDAARADEVANHLADNFASVAGVHLDPSADGYGLTPLQFAPTANSRWRILFSDTQINGALDGLEAHQSEDGGWPVRWEPPGAASLLAWRGVVTLQALRSLTSYGRLRASAP